MQTNSSTKSFLVPLAFIGLMFFSIGFALGINGILIPVLKKITPEGQGYLIVAATFIPFLIFGYPASILIKKIGYKKTMAFSFFLFALAFVLFIPSAKIESFMLFLIASFVSGTANAFLQASVNPYTTILGPIESAAKRISIMGICNKLAWPIPALFLVWIIGKEVDKIAIADLNTPFYILIAVFLFLGILSFFAPLPEVKAQGEEETVDTTQIRDNGKNSVFDFPYLLLGVLALFFYVGVETVALSSLIDFAKSLSIENAEIYAWISPIGMVIGYISGVILIPKYISQSTALKICSLIAIIGSILVCITPTDIFFSFFGLQLNLTVSLIILIAIGCSLMWPAIWPLAMDGLGNFTKTGASLLTMAIAGGAVIPYVFGWLKDSYGMQNAYWICLPCFLFILYYGMAGHKIGKNKL
ncbi:Glucose/galactose transporter [Capnocytophaga canis]|uniref:Glucose/galactose transporter n=2 Tax=Capnocytophaga canis TaxID=1848903 RepID=A0A0B7IU78_9FLAO|nr:MULTISPECIES: MFS transporter [Capnocytophaga]CEN42792.1 Glucose/galactose transporter [Capnocytophaga canis]CEN44881.1 Glucose/galactose transporter [Capnocytophaga canis]CEN53642.1 Glucose/galactose transporter [Capnocytophaga canis]